MIRASLMMICAALAAEPAAAEPRPFAVLAAMPDDPAGGLRLEVALAVDDLRRYRAWADHSRHLAMLSKLGAEFMREESQIEAFGFDWFGELTKIIELAAPGGEPVPAGIAAYSTADGFGAQLLVRVQPGFFERLEQARASERPPRWPSEVEGEELRIPIAENALAGRLGAEGWLRIAPEPAMLVEGHARPLFDGSMQKVALDNDVLLFVRGGGVLASQIAAMLATDPLLADMVATMRSAGIGWKYDGEKTVSTRVMADLPQLTSLGPILRKAGKASTLLELWDSDATSFLSVSLPPALLQAALPLAQNLLGGHPLPEEIATALGKLDGRIGAVSFGSPDDWAVAVQLTSTAAAEALVPALQGWLSEQSGEPSATDYVLESFPGAGEVIHVRPNPGIEGVRVASIGPTLVVVRQKSRLATMARSGDGKRKSLLASPLTETMRTSLETPTALSGYMVLSDDGSLFDYLTWTVGTLEQMWRPYSQVPELAFVGRYLARLPTILALQSFAWNLTYDLAISADIDDSVLVFQVLSSEI